MKNNDKITAEFFNGKMRTRISASDKHLDDAISALLAERVARKERKRKAKERGKLRRFVHRMYLTVRFHRAHKSKKAAAAIKPIGLIPERAGSYAAQ